MSTRWSAQALMAAFASGTVAAAVSKRVVPTLVSLAEVVSRLSRDLRARVLVASVGMASTYGFKTLPTALREGRLSAAPSGG